MKKLVITILLCACLGCNKKAVTAPLPGAINSFDSLSFQSLMDAQAAINAVKADISDGKFKPTPAQKSVLNQAIGDYDLAQAAWQAYHAGATNDVTALQNAINQIVADVAQIAVKIQGAK